MREVCEVARRLKIEDDKLTLAGEDADGVNVYLPPGVRW